MGKILVTGGTGYIGSHTIVALHDEGFDTVLLDNLSNSKAEVASRIRNITGKDPVFEKTEMRNKDELDAVFAKHPDIEAVIHFAASKAVGESVDKPLFYYENNIVSLLNLLQIMLKYQVKHLVFSSSCTVYGQPDMLPVTEKAMIKKANSPYGHTKQIAEEVIENTIKANDSLTAISLRYFNPIGAHISAKIGELPLGVPDNLVPYITQTAIGIREQLHVFGNDYKTPDGTCIRDYIHIEDLAKAHIIACKRLINNNNKSSYEVFNLGTGCGYSVLEVINTFEKVTGVKLNYKIVDRRPGDVEKVFADVSYANTELRWKAEKSLGEMLLSAWKWEKEYGK